MPSEAVPTQPERPSQTHLVVIPSYNSGALVVQTVRDARAHWGPVWVVLDGSTDGSGAALAELARNDPQVRVFDLVRNRGKGAAVLQGLMVARAAGFTHALVMDADGQHPPQCIADFMARSLHDPDAMILGVPIFDASAPALRVKGRRISNWWTQLETLWAGIDDSLFGFRVYPIDPLVRIMRRNPFMRRFDFDVEAAVRLCWRGVRPVSVPAPVRYLTAAEGGVSHFDYLRDNALLTWMHARLFFGFLLRLPLLAWRRLRGPRRPAAD
jgi:glycosyltransferase involved in cell wall biosynthesis